MSNAQLVVISLTALIVGLTFTPLGATPAAIEACRTNPDQKIIKWGGVLITVLVATCGVLYLEVLRVIASYS